MSGPSRPPPGCRSRARIETPYKLSVRAGIVRHRERAASPQAGLDPRLGGQPLVGGGVHRGECRERVRPRTATRARRRCTSLPFVRRPRSSTTTSATAELREVIGDRDPMIPADALTTRSSEPAGVERLEHARVGAPGSQRRSGCGRHYLSERFAAIGGGHSSLNSRGSGPGAGRHAGEGARRHAVCARSTTAQSCLLIVSQSPPRAPVVKSAAAIVSDGRGTRSAPSCGRPLREADVYMTQSGCRFSMRLGTRSFRSTSGSRRDRAGNVGSSPPPRHAVNEVAPSTIVAVVARILVPDLAEAKERHTWTSRMDLRAVQAFV